MKICNLYSFLFYLSSGIFCLPDIVCSFMCAFCFVGYVCDKMLTPCTVLFALCFFSFEKAHDINSPACILCNNA